MKHVLAGLLWTLVLLLLLAGIDQLLVRWPASLPGHVAVAGFYRDLRGRMIGLVRNEPPAPTRAAGAPPKAVPAGESRRPSVSTPDSVEAVIGQRAATVQPPAPPPVPSRPASGRAVRTPPLRYVYADEQGEIHFAETLAEVPEEFREKARALGE